MSRLVACVLVLVLGFPVHAAEPAPDAATIELQAGLAAYERGDFSEAAARFEHSHTLRPDPITLYAWAQASRGAGDCGTAITLYQRFVDEGATGDSREAALQNQRRCREALAAQEPAPGPARLDVPPAASEPAPVVAPARDRTGEALVGSGAALVLASLALLIAAGVQLQAQRRTHDYERFDRLDGRVDGLFIGGSISAGIGAGLVIVGGVKLKRRRRS